MKRCNELLHSTNLQQKPQYQQMCLDKVIGKFHHFFFLIETFGICLTNRTKTQNTII